MTLYDKTMKEMTAEKFAMLNVKPAVMNGSEMFYVTTSGQLFPFTNEGLQNAVNYQFQIFNQEIKEPETEGTDKISEDSAE